VELKANPDDEETNNYFEISFSNVLSAAYNIYIKFAPAGAIKDTKLRFVFSYVDNPDGGGTKEVVHEIPAKVVGAFENGLIKIGGTYSIPVYVGSAKSNPYYVKLKVIIDVSEAELVLFDRKFGIDYIELVPAE